MIKVENLVKKYGGITALNHMNCHFEKGKVTVILGSSGSGKSTLLRQLTGLEKPDSGSVFFDGMDLTTLGKKKIYEIRKKMGMLFQGSALFNYLNVFENIAFPLREHTKIADNIIKIIVTMKLEMVGLRGAQNLMPSQLSGGMMKRAGLARAIVMDPKIIFYDEPTSGLDPISTGVIDKLIKDLNQTLDITTIVVSHDIESCFRIADNIIILFYGDIIAQGTVEEIRNSKDLRVKQFINGEPEGPIPFTRADKDYLDEILFD
ncbi:ABC transporter ATP-binding protein [Desulfobacula phenolica]|uniref:Phospholipid/cholesterol/gamma-HCH transport system ATP-binding protein n=1 Tax=Desulfobacula phenolica TaxID=90732 RepID=A0A1H2GK55_9BACT|nr:ABC transporter ATP-binding protein [Desulfobacula phenolica]SDU20023.1 phospholipid/cholesterol/gamma-HCH transport system ATP-binding protein [Desulfobacula phenolica]